MSLLDQESRESSIAAQLSGESAVTSVQTRAIKTLNLVLEEMDRLWLPVTKDWRFNERHYGGLTGLDKAETAARHGDAQVKLWRRSFDVPPPSQEKGSAFDVSADRRYAGIAVPAALPAALPAPAALAEYHAAGHVLPLDYGYDKLAAKIIRFIHDAPAAPLAPAAGNRGSSP